MKRIPGWAGKGPKNLRELLIKETQMYRNLRQELLTRIYSLFPILFFQQILYANEPGIITLHHPPA